MSKASGRPFLTATVAAAALGCADGSGRSAEYRVVRDTVGDTLVVRTVSGSAWGVEARFVPEVSIGELDGDLAYVFGQVASLGVALDGTIYVVDRQAAELRAYGPDGRHRATFGRRGEGPGELKNPDGGLAVLSDGRVLVRDPGNARIQVYSASGEPAGGWALRGNFSTSDPLFRDERDNAYTSVWMDPEADLTERTMGLARYAPDGTVADTLPIPDMGFEAPVLEARWEGEGGGRGVAVGDVPFSPTEEWTLLPGGYFAHGVSADYRITLSRPESPLRIERDVVPAPVAPGERAEEEERVTRNMRRMVPEWSWNGPPVPRTKPPFRGLYAGRDGRLWVWVWQPGVEADDPYHDPTDPNSLEDRWQEPVAFDVFEGDGTYLGRVTAPTGFGIYPTPVFDGDHMWAVSRDELDVQRVVRYRITRDDGR